MSRQIDEESEELHPSEEQGIEEKEETEKEENIESDEEREKMVDNDEIAPSEDAFMEGAEKLGKGGKCAYCGKVLDEENTYEEEFNGETMWFCSEHCSEKYAKKHEAE